MEEEGLKKTRSQVISLYYMTLAVERKAQCRAVSCDVIDKLDEIAREFDELDGYLTSMIGD